MTPANPLSPPKTPLVILSEGCFGEQTSKTATGVIRYGAWPIVAVIDSTQAGKTVREVTGISCDAPVVSALDEAMTYQPKALLVGTAPQGGGLPEDWRHILAEALRQGLHLISGLHVFLKDDPVLCQLAGEQNLMLWDVRDPPPEKRVAQHRLRPPASRVITMVGSDCSVGKMVTALELDRGARLRNRRSRFIATGQTGILIAGSGLPLDRIIGDFMAGHLEHAIFQALESIPPPEWLFVEGQGSLVHPGYSGVTLSLLHGSNPDALILCHNPSLRTIRGYEVPLPSLSELVSIYEAAANWPKLPSEPRARVVGISLNTKDFSDMEADALLQKAQAETGLPVTDPVRVGVSPLLDALEHFLKGGA